jgi:hypothetical protein
VALDNQQSARISVDPIELLFRSIAIVVSRLLRYWRSLRKKILRYLPRESGSAAPLLSRFSLSLFFVLSRSTAASARHSLSLARIAQRMEKALGETKT